MLNEAAHVTCDTVSVPLWTCHTVLSSSGTHNENDYSEARALSSSVVMFYMYTCHSNYTFKAGNDCGFAVTAAESFCCWCIVWVFCFVLSLNGIVLTQRAPLSLGCMIHSPHWELKSSYTSLFYSRYYNKYMQSMIQLQHQFKLITSKVKCNKSYASEIATMGLCNTSKTKSYQLITAVLKSGRNSFI